MATVRYIGTNKLLSGLIGSLIDVRALTIDGSDCGLVAFSDPRLPKAGREWNLPVRDLEMVA